MMNFEETLSAFLDRALDAQEEAELLHILSVSPDKRALFHDYMDMRGVFTADMHQTAVPSHLDAAIFGGIAAMTGAATSGAIGSGTASSAFPGATAAPQAAPLTAAAPSIASTGAAEVSAPASSLVAGFAWTTGRKLAAILLGASLWVTGWFAHSLVTESAGPVSQEQIAAGADHAVTHEQFAAGAEHQAAQDAGSGGAAGPGDTAPAQQASQPQRTARTGGSVARAIPGGATVTQDEISAEPTVAAGSTQQSVVPPSGDTIYIVGVERMPVPLLLPPPVDKAGPEPRLRAQGPLLEHLEFEVQREHATTYPYIDYRRLGSQRTQANIAGLATWRFDDNHAVGVIVGRKSFSQEYYRMRGDSLDLYQQQPVLSYGAGFYRYALPVLPGVIPQAMVQVGGSDLGPVLGLRVAVTVVPFRQLRLFAGGTGMMLVYHYGNRIFTSQTLGLVYGVNVQF